METYVVRIYRPGLDTAADTDRLRGTVEVVADGSRTTFHDAEQLLSILGARRPQARDASTLDPVAQRPGQVS